MNFDFGEVLTRAGQITWKHKMLWLFSALPALAGMFFIPLFLLPFLFVDFDAYGPPRFLEEPLFFVFFFVGTIVISLLSFVLYGISSASVTWGVLRAEGGEEKLGVRALFDGGQKYWLKVLGVTFLTSVIFSLAVLVFLGCMTLFGVITMGLGFLCIQPFIILLYPLSLVVYGFIEEALAAVVADDLNVVAALQRGWELVKTNFWRILLISFIVYFAISLLGGLFTVPFMFPFFYLPILTDGSAPDMRVVMLFIGGITLFMFPVMVLVQGVGVTFLKAAYALTYLRLTRSKQADAPLVSEANA
ncbi:MAG: hypothetical protein AB1509_03055 [Chloroflexota bacterium]